MIQAISEPLQTSFRSDNYSSTAGRRPLPSRRLADLQDKSPASQTLSLSKFAQLSSGTNDFLSGFLSWDARYLQWCNLSPSGPLCSHPCPNGGRVWGIYRWRSQG